MSERRSNDNAVHLSQSPISILLRTSTNEALDLEGKSLYAVDLNV